MKGVTEKSKYGAEGLMKGVTTDKCITLLVFTPEAAEFFYTMCLAVVGRIKVPDSDGEQRFFEFRNELFREDYPNNNGCECTAPGSYDSYLQFLYELERKEKKHE